MPVKAKARKMTITDSMYCAIKSVEAALKCVAVEEMDTSEITKASFDITIHRPTETGLYEARPYTFKCKMRFKDNFDGTAEVYLVIYKNHGLLQGIEALVRHRSFFGIRYYKIEQLLTNPKIDRNCSDPKKAFELKQFSDFLLDELIKEQ